MKPALRVASATAILAVLLSASVAGSSADPTPTASDGPSGHTSTVRLVDSITSEPDQDRSTVSDWQEPSVALSEVSRLVPVLIEEHPENFSGVEIDLSGRWVNVFLVDPEGAGTDRLRDLAEEFGSELIKVVRVDTARADLDAAKDRIVSGEFGFVPTMSYVDPEAGRVRVQLPDTSYRVADVDSVVIELFTDEPVVEVDGSEQPIASGIPELAQWIDMPAVAEELSVRLDVAVEKPLLIRPNNGPRHQSSVPFAAGAKIINYANSETCSASMPIALHGVRMIATAAHCTPYGTTNANHKKWVTPAASGNLVGSLEHSPYLAGNFLAGDWQLLRGASSYALKVYTGGPLGTSTAPLTGGDFTLRPKNGALVSSGQATGMKASYWVHLTGVQASVCSPVCRTTNHNTFTTHGTSPTVADSNGWANGDSGGFVGYADLVRPGNYWGYGIISGSAARSPSGMWYVVSELRAIKQWNPNATVIP